MLNNRKTGILMSYGYTLINMFSGLFLSSFLLRSLGDFEYGLYQTVSAFVSYLVILEFGTGTVMCRNLLIARKSNDEEKIKKVTATMFYITAFLTVVIFVVGVVFTVLIPKIYADNIPKDKLFYAQKIFVVMLFYLIVSFFTQTLSGMYLGNENYTVTNIFNITKLVSRLVLLIVFVTLYDKAITIALVDAFISVGVIIFSFFYVKSKYVISLKLKYFDKEILKESLPLCFALLLQVIISQANSNVGKFVISIKMTMEHVSLYSVAMYVYNMFSSITTIPISMYMPQVSKSINKGVIEKEGLENTLISSGRLNSLIGGTILFGFIAVGKPFINVVYGKSYESAWIYAIIVLIPMFLNMTVGCIINVLDMLNKRQVRSYILAISTAINIALAIALTDRYGMAGAITGTTVGLFLGQVLLSNIYYQKALSINVIKIYLQSFKGILISEIIAVIIGGLIAYFITNKVLALLLGGFAFVIVEAICLLLFGLNKQEKGIATGFLTKLKK
ncbi:MAG: oligosaccharide flippase family protein [Clostridia bacterium]|nr:oligosaccharide flippase family protein [Clostridia bacterium]